MDSVTNEPVPRVIVKCNEQITYTDEVGKFYFDINEGNLFIERIGYQKFEYYFDDRTSQMELTIDLAPQSYILEGIKTTETRAANRKTPVTFSNISKEEIAEKNVGQDIPLLMNDIPNVYSYSESGSGVGYSHLKVRGFDEKRIGVMINGIPLNDPEDHNVYWVNMPDLAESMQDVQFQRGVGSSLYGVSSFGGSMNIETSDISSVDDLQVFSNFGSYDTYKLGMKFTKNFLNKYKINLRLSKVKSEGYRDNSASYLWAFYTSMAYKGKRSITELNFYGGNEKTHASWYASYEGDLEENHQQNPITYDNEIDDFSQPHLELHHRYYLNKKSDLVNTFFYIHGNGFYEQFKAGRDLWEYGLNDIKDAVESDLVRQKKVIKNQYGWVSKLSYSHTKGKLTIGGYISLFDSEHFGEVVSLETEGVIAPDFYEGFEYYNYTGDKKYYTFYANEQIKLFKDLNLMANLYYQKINYKFEQHEAGNFEGAFLNSYEVDYDFFNPRFGVNYNISKSLNTYANVSLAHREPTDAELYDTWDGPDDLGVTPLFAESESITNASGDTLRIEWSDPYVKPEKLMNYELGFGYVNGIWNIQTNFFMMNFQNEIIAYGGADDDGSPIRGNADETVHRGVEFSVKTELPNNLYFDGNLSYNDNYFKKFIMKDWAGDIDLTGKKIAGFPDILGNAKISYRTKMLTTFIQIQHVGKQYLDNTENEERTINAFSVANAAMILRLANLGMKNIELSARMNNILNLEYETSGYYDSWGGPTWSGANYYFPAAGRNFMFGVRCGF
jgi:iron complex outermembrane receptor protein